MVAALLTAAKLSAPTLVHVIAVQDRDSLVVTAVTSVGDDVFIMCSQHVQVYNADTFTLRRRISVPGLGCYGRPMT